MIQVDKKNETTFDVQLDGPPPTSHTVTVQPDVLANLTGGSAPAEKLVTASFEFLLERESNTSIMRKFDLTVIGRYFPEYERAMKSRFGA